MSADFQPLPGTSLPIFRSDREMECWFYAPGYLVLTGRDQADQFEALLISGNPGNPAAVELIRRAKLAVQQRREIEHRPFAPVCLTLYLNNICNLACSYCYSQPETDHPQRLEMDVIRAAAELVAETCKASQQRMTVVFHGGGEPSLEQSRLEQALEVVEQASQEEEVGLFRYIASNGVMPAEKAAWMARRFDLIGLSCDGPEAVQSRQRPLRSGQSSTAWLESTARLVQQAGKPLHVRVTVTPASMHQQEEIAAYICEQLVPQEIHVEPLYQAGLARAEDCFEAGQAEAFAEAFLRARRIANRHSVRWTTSGSRPAEIHGAYCHVFRQVLNLIPNGEATACFLLSRAEQLQQSSMAIGGFDPLSKRYILNQERVDGLQEGLSRQPTKCADCFNQFHCTRGCPDLCLANDPDAGEGEFRCRVNRLLALAAIEECAAALRNQRTNAEQVVGGAIA